MKTHAAWWVAVLAAGWLAAGCSGSGAEPKPKSGGARGMLPVAVRTARVQAGEVSEKLQFTGELESPLSVQVAAKGQGRLGNLA